MAIFNCYVSSPEGSRFRPIWVTCPNFHQNWWTCVFELPEDGNLPCDKFIWLDDIQWLSPACCQWLPALAPQHKQEWPKLEQNSCKKKDRKRRLSKNNELKIKEYLPIPFCRAVFGLKKGETPISNQQATFTNDGRNNCSKCNHQNISKPQFANMGH